jgi:16S rRNA (guanine1207-N2)-methyltransferase
MEHYYSKKPSSELKLFRVKADLLGQHFELYSASGVFSAKEVDNGTALLVEAAIIKDDWEVLDLGCGYGIVGVAVAKAYGASHKIKVTMADVNERAVMLAKRNAQTHCPDAVVLKSSGFDKISGEFDTILFNPPQTAGKKLCFQLIEESKSRLKKNGLLQLVARHNKGGKELCKKMEEVFGNADDTAKGGGFRVYVSRKE